MSVSIRLTAIIGGREEGCDLQSAAVKPPWSADPLITGCFRLPRFWWA